MVRNLVQDDPPDFAPQPCWISPVVTHEWAAVDGDLVRRYTGIAAAAPGQRETLIQAQERLPSWRLVLDHDRDVRDRSDQVFRQRRKRFLHPLFERRMIRCMRIAHLASVAGPSRPPLLATTLLSVWKENGKPTWSARLGKESGAWKTRVDTKSFAYSTN